MTGSSPDPVVAVKPTDGDHANVEQSCNVGQLLLNLAASTFNKSVIPSHALEVIARIEVAPKVMSRLALILNNPEVTEDTPINEIQHGLFDLIKVEETAHAIIGECGVEVTSDCFNAFAGFVATKAEQLRNSDLWTTKKTAAMERNIRQERK